MPLRSNYKTFSLIPTPLTKSQILSGAIHSRIISERWSNFSGGVYGRRTLQYIICTAYIYSIL